MEVSEDLNGSMVDSQEPSFDLDTGKRQDNYPADSSGSCISKSEENIVSKQFLDASISPSVNNCVVGEKNDDISVKFRLVSESDGHIFSENLEKKCVESDAHNSVESDYHNPFESEVIKGFEKHVSSPVQIHSVSDCLESEQNNEHSFVARDVTSSSEIISEPKSFPIVNTESALSPEIVSTTAKGENLFFATNISESNSKCNESETTCNSLKNDSNPNLSISTCKDSEVSSKYSKKDDLCYEQIDDKSHDNHSKSPPFQIYKGSSETFPSNFISSPERNNSFTTDDNVNENIVCNKDDSKDSAKQFEGTAHLSEDESSDSQLSDSEKSELFMKTSNDSTPVLFESQSDTDVSISVDGSVGFGAPPIESKYNEPPSFPSTFPVVMEHQSLAHVDHQSSDSLDHQSPNALSSAVLDHHSSDGLDHPSSDTLDPSTAALSHSSPADAVDQSSDHSVDHISHDALDQPSPSSLDHQSPTSLDDRSIYLDREPHPLEQESNLQEPCLNFGLQLPSADQPSTSSEKGNHLKVLTTDEVNIDQSKDFDNSDSSKLTMCDDLRENSEFNDTSKLSPDVPSNLSFDHSLDHTSNSKISSSQGHTITYTGYKTPRSKDLVTYKKLQAQLNSMGNPFNFSWKKGHGAKTFSIVPDSCVSDDQVLGTDQGASLPEYTQYLGLQPTVNFKCNHCGTSGYESIQMLNVHQMECRKALKHSTSTNIKFTRKVYLCSVCGTYYNSCYLFIHMRERHEKFICLHCLAMFPNSDKLREHLTLKHQVNLISFSDLETFKKCNIPTYFLLCLDCDSGLSEKDDFKHVCDRGTNDSFSDSLCTSVVVNPLDNSKQNIEPIATTSDSPQKKETLNNDEPKSIDSCNASSQETIDVHDLSSQPIKDQSNIDSTKQDFNEVPVAEDSIESESVLNMQEVNLNQSLITETSCNIGSETQTPLEEVATDTNIPTLTPVNYEIKPPKSKGTKRVRGKNSSSQQSKKKKRSLKQIVCDSQEVLVTKPEEDVLKNDLPTDNISPERDFIPEDISVNSSENKSEQNIGEIHEQKPLLWKPGLDKNILKFNLQADVDTDDESDDSNKLSMVIDETPATSDNDSKSIKPLNKGLNNSSDESNHNENHSKLKIALEEPIIKMKDDIPLAGEDVPTMALTLDDRVEDVQVQLILKECVRTSCLSCNYCRRAVKIAVNGKQLALHLLSEHRYTPVKNDSPDDVIKKLKSSLEELNSMYFNTESYDSSDPAIFIPYDQDNTFDCFQCNYVTNSHKDLYMHKRKSHTKSLLLCIMCKSNFYSYSELLCHLCPGHYNSDESMNNVDINYRCCFCRLDTIPSAFRLMVHLRKCHHTCDICLEICPDQQKLSTHMWKHKLNHLCYRCGIAYASKPDITKHLFWKHGTESVLCKKCLQKKWPHVYHFCIPPTSFICEECNSSFSKAVALKVHKRIHAGDFAYSCSMCEKKFISKKLLSRHEDRHNLKPVKKEATDVDHDDTKPKEEIIDVTGVENPDASSGSISVDPKESDKESDNNKHHKKHRKDKKSKPVIDVYDLPPLNLSSESDSSDEENQKKAATSDSKADSLGLESLIKKPDENIQDKDLSTENTSVIENLDKEGNPLSHDMEHERNSDNLTKEQSETFTELSEGSKDSKNEIFAGDLSSSKSIGSEQTANDTAENIWENFYKTNSQNKNLPYPLCAMKTEVAYGIIMGDHDYCQQVKYDPVINEDIPTSSNLDNNLNDIKSDNLDIDSNSTKLDSLNVSSDISPKKKQKSPKKKVSKNNSSSSSDSSSDSDSSSCSCGTKCSCSSSSSDSSSSSSSDSDSSASDGKQKSDKRKKKKERKIKTKVENSTEPNKEIKVDTEPDIPPPIPEDPAIRESELETDETTTDEEFYDRQPQKVVNQLLAEKRNQLMLLASVAPVNNGNISPIPGQDPPQAIDPTPASVNNNEIPMTTPTPDLTSSKRKVTKTRRKRNLMTKGRQKPNPKLSLSSPSQVADVTPSMYKPNVKPKEHKYDKSASRFLNRNFPTESSMGSGSESENLRASKRRRIPNKFYGYSSGEEEEKLSMAPIKWKKQEAPTPPPPVVSSLPPAPLVQKIIHTTPQTPRIQLSVPKQVIRKSHAVPKYKSYSSSNDSSDSGSEEDIMKFSHQPKIDPVPEIPKADKNVYCYCRCPYDEVSEMIACDDTNCKIEWFHFECVGILVPPKGQWFCPECKKKRGLSA